MRLLQQLAVIAEHARIRLPSPLASQQLQMARAPVVVDVVVVASTVNVPHTLLSKALGAVTQHSPGILVAE